MVMVITIDVLDVEVWLIQIKYIQIEQDICAIKHLLVLVDFICVDPPFTTRMFKTILKEA